MHQRDRDTVEWFSDRGLSALLDDTRLGGGTATRAVRTVLSVVAFVTRELWGGLVSTGPAMARTLPLLLGVVTFFFFTSEVWQSVGMLSGGAYAAAVLLFVVVSAAFLASRKRLDVAALSRFESAADLEAALAGTPLQQGEPGVEVPATCPLSRGQSRTLRLVATVSRLVVTAVVGTSVLLFFTVLGTVAVPTEVVAAWTTVDPSVLAEIPTDRRTFAVTAPLLRVAGFLAAFSALYYAVVSVVDPTMRQEERDTVSETVRGACAARLVVLASTDPADPSA
ncbi:hypothetical protein [Oryzobacter terrae]|uniref:hypothetical protein n=1 Tax=Oryzobacter terrae TaxID=1620385 RepID=UPI00366DE1DB